MGNGKSSDDNQFEKEHETGRFKDLVSAQKILAMKWWGLTYQQSLRISA